jgi:hypothetical protein
MKKIKICLIAVVLTTGLSIGLTKIVKADAPGDPYAPICNYWCLNSTTNCRLHVTFSDGTTGYITCPGKYWSE